jgi:hypothetical protein
MGGQSDALRYAVKQKYKGELSAACAKPLLDIVKATITYASRGLATSRREHQIEQRVRPRYEQATT